MAFAGFEDLNECRLQYEDDEHVEDPRKFCNWLQSNADKLDDADRVLLQIDTKYVSPVESPAQDSQWITVKDEDGDDQIRAEGELIVKSDEEMKAVAPVLVANDTDKQRDVVPDFVVRDAAHRFMEKLASDDWMDTAEIDADHDERGGRGTPVESWTLDEDKTYTTVGGATKTYPENTWMMEVKFEDRDVWERVKAGEIEGWSIQGPAVAEDLQKSVDDEEDQIMTDEDIEALSEGMDDITDTLSDLSKQVAELSEDEQDDEEVEETELTEDDVREIAKDVAESVADELTEEFETDDDTDDVQKEVEVERKVSEEEVEKEEVETDDEPNEVGYDHLADI